MLVCYKTGSIPIRVPPPVPIPVGTSPQLINNNSEVEKALNRLNLNNWNPNQPVSNNFIIKIFKT